MTVPETFPSKLLEDAVQAIGSLPGVGKRSALRLALHLLRQPSENVHHFADSIVKMRDEAKYCRQCWMISDEDICPICADKSRDHKTICVVENVRDVMSIENTGAVSWCLSRAWRNNLADRRNRPVGHHGRPTG